MDGTAETDILLPLPFCAFSVIIALLKNMAKPHNLSAIARKDGNGRHTMAEQQSAKHAINPPEDRARPARETVPCCTVADRPHENGRNRE